MRKKFVLPLILLMIISMIAYSNGNAAANKSSDTCKNTQTRETTPEESDDPDAEATTTNTESKILVAYFELAPV